MRSQSNKQETKARHIAITTSYYGRRLAHLRCVTISFNKSSKSKPLMIKLSNDPFYVKVTNGYEAYQMIIGRNRNSFTLLTTILLLSRWQMATRLIKWLYLASSPTGPAGRMSCQGDQSCFRINNLFSWTFTIKKSQWKLPNWKLCAGGTIWCSLQTPR